MLPADPKSHLDNFFREVGRSRQSALLLDYDGTLAPFRRNRHLAVPYPGIVPLLKRIMDTGCTRMVVISGRRAHEIIPLLQLSPAPEIWGTHGIERLRGDGTYERLELDRVTLNALLDAERWAWNVGLHHLLEHKPGSLALHWRELSKDEVQDIRDKVLQGWGPIAENACLTLEEFDGGIEVRAANRNKGDAVRTILTEMEVNSPVAYLGDDQTDEAAFRALRGRGLSVLVRPQWRETDADIWIRPPIQLSAFLHDWLQASCQAPLDQPQWFLSGVRERGASGSHG